MEVKSKRDALFGEISAAAKAMGLDGTGKATGFNPYANNEREKVKGARSSADYTDEELLQIYQNI